MFLFVLLECKKKNKICLIFDQAVNKPTKEQFRLPSQLNKDDEIFTLAVYLFTSPEVRFSRNVK